MILLDTSALIDFLNDTPKGARVEGHCKNETVAVSAVTVNEVLTGLTTKDARTEAFLLSLEALPFGRAEALEAARLERALLKKGRPIGKLDTFIAATALVCRVPLLTTDAHFRAVPGLEVRAI